MGVGWRWARGGPGVFGGVGWEKEDGLGGGSSKIQTVLAQKRARGRKGRRMGGRRRDSRRKGRRS